MGQSRPPSVTPPVTRPVTPPVNPLASPSVERPISARRAATRERLLGAAKEVFAERGIHGAAVEDICEAAGFTRGAFYSNFASKEELLVALVAQEHAQLMDRVNAAVDDPLPDSADVVDVVDHIVDRFLAASPLDRPSLLLHGEFQQFALRDPWAAQVLVQKDDEVRVELAALVVGVLARAGRRLVVSEDDAVRTVTALFETAIVDVHLRQDGGPVDTAPFRRSIALFVRALSEPVEGPVEGPVGQPVGQRPDR